MNVKRLLVFVPMVIVRIWMAVSVVFVEVGSAFHHLETYVDIKQLPILFVSDINECEEVAGICTNGDCQNLDGSFS